MENTIQILFVKTKFHLPYNCWLANFTKSSGFGFIE